MRNIDIAKKQNLPYRIVANYRHRYIYGKAKRIPPLEQAIKLLERGRAESKIINRFGEEVFNEAKSWV